MNLRKQLAIAHSRANADLILAYLFKNKAETAALWKVVSSSDPADAKLVKRAAMVLGDLGRARPDWLLPYHGRMLRLAAESPDPAIPRAVTRYFSELPLAKVTEEDQGALLEASFHYLNDPEATVTMKVFSMTTLGNFAALHPELKDEVRGLIERQVEEGEHTAGFYSRARKVLAAL